MSEEIEITIDKLREDILEKNRQFYCEGGLIDQDAENAMQDFAEVMMKAFLMWFHKLPEEEKIEEQDGVDQHEVARTYVEMFKRDVTSIKGKWS